jgi:antirestriction protein ArdC
MPYKPLYEQVAAKVIAQIEAGNSPFQKPFTEDINGNFKTPVNQATGNTYKDMNALWLGLQNQTDHRWMTEKQAKDNNFSVADDQKPTLITFLKNESIVPLLDGNNEKLIDENHQVMTQTIKLEKPVLTNAWVFNGKQITGIPELKPQGDEQKPGESRIQDLITNGKVKIEFGGKEAYYDLEKDQIHLPKKAGYKSLAEYYATALQQMVSWTGHPDRLNRPAEENNVKEDLRKGIASLFLGSEMKIGSKFELKPESAEKWVQLLKAEPKEIYKAAAGAQKIVDYLVNIEQNREQKQATSAKTNPDKVLVLGDKIDYNNTQYTVIEQLKGKVKSVIVEDLNENRMKVSPKDVVYKSLVDAKNNPKAIAAEVKEAIAVHEEVTEQAKPKIGR